jgi:hypothetical protein
VGQAEVLAAPTNSPALVLSMAAVRDENHHAQVEISLSRQNRILYTETVLPSSEAFPILEVSDAVKGDGGVLAQNLPLEGDETTDIGGVMPMKSRSFRLNSDLKSGKYKYSGQAESWLESIKSRISISANIVLTPAVLDSNALTSQAKSWFEINQ